MSALKALLTLLFLFSLPFQDLGLQRTALSTLGSSVAFLPLMMLLTIDLFSRLYKADCRFSKTFVFVVIYIVAVTITHLAILGVESHGVSLVHKAITTALVLALFGYSVFGITYERYPRVTRLGVRIAFLLVIIGVAGSDFGIGGADYIFNNDVFHFTPYVDGRPRGLTNEASYLSVQIAAIGFTCAHLARGRSWRVLLLLSTIGLLVASGSKGAVATLALSLAGFALLWFKRRQLVPVMSLVVPILVLASVAFLNRFTESSLEEFTTAATRASMAVCAVNTAVHHPLGVGLSGFLPAITRYLPKSMEIVQSWSNVPLNFLEVAAYAYKAENVSTKTFFFDQLARFGIPFVVVFYVFIRRIVIGLLKIRSGSLLFAVLFVTIAICTYVQPLTFYSVAVVYGVALSELRKAKLSGCSERLPIPPESRGAM